MTKSAERTAFQAVSVFGLVLCIAADKLFAKKA